MSAEVEGEGLHHEIIVVRRGGFGDEDGHHGGVWKIAFADFMTALMCFFLVMWLINAANEQTRAALASYFNPVKLVDRNTSRKGLDDPDKNTQSSDREGRDKASDSPQPANSGPADQKKSADDDSKKQHSDQNLFANPYAVLSEIAGETGVMQNVSAKGAGGAQKAGPATGASGGDAYRDPFVPNFWSKEVDADADAGNPSAASPAKAAASQGAVAAKNDLLPAPNAEDARRAAAAEPQAETGGKLENDDAPKAEKGPHPSAAVKAEAAAISKELARDFGKDDQVYQGLSVVPTDKGVMIAVTDQLNFGMFEVGSAVPRRELVLAMEKIAKTLAAHKGAVRINGHTDARPFKSATYDNWRLSSARAQTAYYMLTRAGLDEKRVISVAGFADRELKVKDDPYAAANRRIEILLESGG